MSEAKREILNVVELSELLHCQPSTVREAARSGRLPGVKYGDDWVFPLEAVLKTLNEQALDQAQQRRTPPKLTSVYLAGPKEPMRNSRSRPRPDLSMFTPKDG
jgi:excisionase family DNA binding protein